MQIEKIRKELENDIVKPQRCEYCNAPYGQWSSLLHCFVYLRCLAQMRRKK
jgi:hypothetical protein